MSEWIARYLEPPDLWFWLLFTPIVVVFAIAEAVRDDKWFVYRNWPNTLP